MMSNQSLEDVLHNTQAIEEFSALIFEEMVRNHDKVRHSWWTCSNETLWQMLREHVEKGDPRDVGILAMMIAHNTKAASP